MRTRQRAALVLLCLLTAASAAAEIRTRTLTYKQGDTTLQGYLAWDAAVADRRPGIIVIHEWWGQNDHARRQAVRLAEAGYVGFAIDMYGKGKVTMHPAEAEAFMNAVLKASLAGPRFEAALAQLKKDPMVPLAQVEAFAADAKASGADVTVVTYAGAKHGFTNTDAASYGMDGLAYDAKADAASWTAALTLLHQVFR